MSTLTEAKFKFTNQTSYYKGKVREVYGINDDLLVMVASDRISAFDVVLPKGIPFKGQVLNQIAFTFLKATEDIVPNWLIDSPDPVVSIGKKAEPFKVEMVIRGYLTGHAARVYNSGLRTLCGVSLPEGLKNNEKFPNPIITPTTKADQGHDEDISREDIISSGIVSKADYEKLENYTFQLYKKGTEYALSKNLLLVDTKYEFGKYKNDIILIDEIHTPDSSRYFYADTYQGLQDKDQDQRQLSKEFVRQWLIENGFQGKENQEVPLMSDEIVNSISKRYIELYENITGDNFIKRKTENMMKDIESNIKIAL